MKAKTLAMIAVQSRDEWRNWLRAHHDSEAGVWLVFSRRHAAERSISYDDVVEEALCFGWIDSIVKRLDDDRYARKLTPRKSKSRWSNANRRRYADLKARGLLAAPGLARSPTRRSGDATRLNLGAIPSYIQDALNENPRARIFYDELAPSFRRLYIGWIHSAKREETRQRRLAEAVGMLAAGKKPGLK